MNDQTQMAETPTTQSTEVQAEQGSAILFDLHTLAHFREKGLSTQVLSDIGTARVVLFAFKAGQQLKEHQTTSQILVQVVRGDITFTTPSTSMNMQVGMLLQLEASIPHSIVAQTDAVVLVAMLPSPTYHSLEQEVFQELTPLVTRSHKNS
ncbi:MAG: hypothetical protein M3Y81_28800 [Chloroflexota bacterium]|nr:hypothetical protein [Chloroflexota bacterium]